MPVFSDHPELLSSFQHGEVHALERVYRAYRGPIEAYLRSRLARWGWAKIGGEPVPDLVQGVFLRAFEPRARFAYDPNRAYAPYLRSVARNHFLDVARRASRERLWPDNDFPDIPAREPEGESSDPEVIAIVRNHLTHVSEATKQLYEERFVFGKSQAAAGDCLGMSRQQVRTNELHLKQEMRRALVRSGFRSPTQRNGV